MGRKASYPRSIQFEGAVVRVVRRRNGMFALRWREDGAWKTTTRADEADAIAWAQEKARTLARSESSQWVHEGDAQAVAELRKMSGGGSRESMAKLLGDLREALEILDGRAPLARAARWFVDFGPQASEPMTVRDAGSRFLKEYEGGSKATQRTFGTEVKAFMAAHGDAMLHEITEPMLRAWVDRRTKPDRRRPAPRTVLSRITTLTTLYNRAKDWGVLPEVGKSAAEKLRRPKIPSASRTIFSVEQGRRLLAAVRTKEPKLETFLLLGGWLGLRPSEAVKVRAGDFDFEGGYLHATLATVLKTGQERYVPMAAPVSERLQELVGNLPAGKRVCVYRSREYLSVLARAEQIVETWPTDVLRHSFCSYRLALLGDIGKVAEEAGNSPKMIRDHYRRPVTPEAGAAWWALIDQA